MKEIEKRGNGYRFFPGNQWSWVAIRETYQGFFKDGLNFWTQQPYDIPLGTTVPVLVAVILLESLIQGVLRARYDFLSRFFSQVGGLVIQIGFLGFILLMKEWLQARGTFREYLSFTTYARFILLPLALLSAASTQLGMLLNLLAFLWILYAFYKTFRLVLSRFLILASIIWGIAFLAFVAAFVTGLKMIG